MSFSEAEQAEIDRLCRSIEGLAVEARSLGRAEIVSALERIGRSFRSDVAPDRHDAGAALLFVLDFAGARTGREVAPQGPPVALSWMEEREG